MTGWLGWLRDDPLPWLLDQEAPAVRHLALRHLLDRRVDDPEVATARAAAMAAPPIRPILDAQDPAGWWVKPGPGYGPKYDGTVWNLTFLEQMGADGSDARVARACEYVLAHTQASSGGFGMSAVARETPPPPSMVLTCLNGNLVRALVGLGRIDDPRLARAVAWQAAAITGEGVARWYASTPGPGFRCGANEGLPCAWGAAKAVLALAAIPPERRDGAVRQALEAGVAFLLSRDPSAADYPMGYGNTKPNGSWFRLGFPVAYVTDVLQVMEALCEAGAAGDGRLERSVGWLLAQQDERGRWANRYPYTGKLVADVDEPGRPSRWVTLRACRVLKAVAEARQTA